MSDRAEITPKGAGVLRELVLRRHDEGADARADRRRRGRAADAVDRPLEVEVLEVLDVHGDVASALVRSAVYHEYLHLVRTPEG